MHLWGITGVLPGDACPGGKELMLDTSLPVMLDSDAQPQHRTGAGFTSPLQQLKRWGEDMARPVIPGQQVADVIPEKSETKEQVQGGPAHCLWMAFAWQHRGRGPGGGQCLTRLRRQKAEFMELEFLRQSPGEEGAAQTECSGEEGAAQSALEIHKGVPLGPRLTHTCGGRTNTKQWAKQFLALCGTHTGPERGHISTCKSRDLLIHRALTG